ADILTAARVSTGHDLLRTVSAGRSLQFPAIVGSVDDFRDLSALVLTFATQDAYRRSHGWIDYTVPEGDAQVAEAVLDRIWKGVDDAGQAINVEIAWWEDVREAGSDHPVTHWRLAHEHRERRPSRRLTLTWPAVKALIARRVGATTPGHQALMTEI